MTRPVKHTHEEPMPWETELHDRSGSADIAAFLAECRRLEGCHRLRRNMSAPRSRPAPARIDWLTVTAWLTLLACSWGIVAALVWAVLA